MTLDLFLGMGLRFGGGGEADDLGDLAAAVVVGALDHGQVDAAPGRGHRGLSRQPGQAARSVVGRRRQQGQRVHAAALGPAAVVLVALAGGDGDGVLADAAVDVDGRLERAVWRADRHHVAGSHADALGGGRVHLDPGIPDDLGDRVGQLLQPGPVGAASVVQVGRRVDEERVGRARVAVQCRLIEVDAGDGAVERDRLCPHRAPGSAA